MVGNIWRLGLETADLHTHCRRVFSLPKIDVAFVTNMRDETDRKRYIGNTLPGEGHFNGPRLLINGCIGQTRSICCITNELLTSSGRRKAKEQFISATRWAERQGARVVLLAASTKRLFGHDGDKLKKMFPNILFTIGDNGTAFMLCSETKRALNSAGLYPGQSRVAILGPYGILGEMVTCELIKNGYEVVGAGPNTAGLEKIKNKFSIETVQNFDAIGKVDAVISCTHSKKICLTKEAIEHIRKKNKKMLVVDVSEPSNLTAEEYKRCNGYVVRQDAGNAYSKNLKYVLGPISYKMFRLSSGVTFGCFAEALSLFSALKRGNESVKSYNWFSVCEENIGVVEELFKFDGFEMPSPRCFSKPVDSFSLFVN